MFDFNRHSVQKATALIALALAGIMGSAGVQAAPKTGEEVLRVWPGDAPGAEQWSGPEIVEDGMNPGVGKIQVKKNVSVPTLTVFRPAKGKANGTAMLVLPGGAFGMLAWDLEGTEVARWLADRGITAFVLKYRVRPWSIPPGQKPPQTPAEYRPLLEPGRRIAVADASEAIRLVRRNAAQYGIRPDRIGMIGFSAGGATTMGVILEADAAARPDFAAPIYGMTMLDNPAVPADAPPLFLATAQDDPAVPADRSTQIFELWNKAGRPAELHLYEKGGHGYGMRPQNLPVDAWPTAFEAWLRWRELIPKAGGGARRATAR